MITNAAYKIPKTLEPFRLSPFKFVFKTQPGYIIAGDVTAKIYDEQQLLFDSSQIIVEVEEAEVNDRAVFVVTFNLTQEQVDALPELSQVYFSWNGAQKIWGPINPVMGAGVFDTTPFEVQIIEVLTSGDSGTTLAAASEAIEAKNTAVEKATEAETAATLAATNATTAQEKAAEAVTSASTAAANSTQTALDRAAIATDKEAVASDKTTVQSLSADVTTKAAQVTASATQVSTDASLAVSSKNAAAASELVATQKAILAQNAADAAMVNTPAFETIAAGTASSSVAIGEFFQVINLTPGAAAGQFYKKTGTGPTDYIAGQEYPSSATVQTIDEKINATAIVNYVGVSVTGESRVGGTNALYTSTFTSSDDSYGKKAVVTLSVDQALTHPTFIFPASGDFVISDNKDVILSWKLNNLTNNNAGVSFIIGGKTRTTDSYTLFSISRIGAIVRLINVNGAFVSTSNLTPIVSAAIANNDVVKYVLKKTGDFLSVKIYRNNTLLLDHTETALPAIKNIYAALKSSVDASFFFQLNTKNFADYTITDTRITSNENSIVATNSTVTNLSTQVATLNSKFAEDLTTRYVGETLTKLTRSVGANTEVTTMVMTQSDATFGRDVKMEVSGSPGNTFFSVIYSTETFLLADWDEISVFGKPADAPSTTAAFALAVVNNRALNGYLEYFSYLRDGSITTAKIDSVFISTTSIRGATTPAAYVLNDEIEIKIYKDSNDAYQIAFYKNGVLNYTHTPSTLKVGSEILPAIRSNARYQIKTHAYLDEWERIKKAFQEGDVSPAQESGVRKIEWKFNNAVYSPTLISRKTAAPNTMNSELAGNTGLSWDTKRNEYVVSLYNFAAYSALWLYPPSMLANYATTGTVLTNPRRKIDLTAFIDHIQGNAYDPILDAYWVIGNKKGTTLLDTNKVLMCFNQDGEPIDYYEFTSLSFQAGMLAYYQNEQGVESLFIKPNNKTWLLEINKKTKEIIRQPTVFTQYEGLAVNTENGDIWLGDDNGTIKRFSNALVELSSYTSQALGNEVEGMAWIPSINALAIGYDAYLHGSNNNGNCIDLYNFTGDYNQKINLPYTYSWAKGTVGQGLRVNEYNDLVGVGVYETPVLDMGAFTDFVTNLLAITQTDKTVAIQYRGSATVPTLTVDSSTTLPIYRGWGATVPGAYQSSPPALRYVQAKLTIS